MLRCAARRDDHQASAATGARAMASNVVDLDSRRPGAEVQLDGADPDSPEGRLAANLQAHYVEHGLSLADPDTAAAHQVALAWVMLMLDGAHATGSLDEAQVTMLQSMVSAAQGAPDVL